MKMVYTQHIRYLLDTLNFLDETRVGVWGWGYGGYVTAMILGTQQNVFKCGIAVSPISDWLYYSKYSTLYLYLHSSSNINNNKHVSNNKYKLPHVAQNTILTTWYNMLLCN